jgi:MFS family permease
MNKNNWAMFMLVGFLLGLLISPFVCKYVPVWRVSATTYYILSAPVIVYICGVSGMAIGILVRAALHPKGGISIALMCTITIGLVTVPIIHWITNGFFSYPFIMISNMAFAIFIPGLCGALGGATYDDQDS